MNPTANNNNSSSGAAVDARTVSAKPMTQAEQQLRKTGIFANYLQALDRLRTKIRNLDQEVYAELRIFYQLDTTFVHTGDQFIENCGYLSKIRTDLDECNAVLERHKKPRLPVMCHNDIAKLLTAVMRVETQFSPLVYQAVNEFANHSQQCQKALMTLCDNFFLNIYIKLKEACLSYAIYQPGQNTLGEQYSMEVNKYLDNLKEKETHIRQLVLGSFEKLTQKHIHASSLSVQLMTTDCNVQDYALLYFIPELSLMLRDIFRTAHTWLDREETYIYEVNLEIQKTRERANEREAAIVQAQVQYRDLMRSVRTAYLGCQNSKRKLNQLSRQLVELEEERLQLVNVKTVKEMEKEKKSNMAEFLQSISHTKKNQILLLKKQKITRQVKEMESNLESLQTNLRELSQEVNEKITEKAKLENKFNEESESYSSIRVDLLKFTKDIQLYQGELQEIKTSLRLLEGIQTVKTSVETLDTLRDEPSSPVRLSLAPSLQAKLQLSRRSK